MWYRKKNITSFIFPSKNLEASGDFIMKLYVWASISAKIISI